MTAKKPTGQIGPVAIRADGPTAGWERVTFSADKSEIEQHVIRYFVDAMRATGATILEVQQNEESDLDFTLILPSGPVLMELTEAQYRDGPGRPYDSRQIRIQSLDYARQIVEAVHAKSSRYTAGALPLHLLVYVTHWRFDPNEVVIRLAQHLLSERPPIFEYVFFLAPTDDKHADLRLLYPSDNPLEGRSLEELRDHYYLNIDPAGWRVVRRNGSSGDQPA